MKEKVFELLEVEIFDGLEAQIDSGQSSDATKIDWVIEEACPEASDISKQIVIDQIIKGIESKYGSANKKYYLGKDDENQAIKVEAIEIHDEAGFENIWFYLYTYLDGGKDLFIGGPDYLSDVPDFREI